jgi:hypothetical protein
MLSLEREDYLLYKIIFWYIIKSLQKNTAKYYKKGPSEIKKGPVSSEVVRLNGQSLIFSRLTDNNS